MRYRKKLARIVCCIISLLLFAGGSMSVEAEAADTSNPTVTATVPVSCEKADTAETFRYQLHGEMSGYEQIENTELELKAGEKGGFSVTYNYPGTYHYTISQTKGNDKYTTYDETVYTVDIYVTETEDGTLVADPVLYRQGDACKRAEARFKNIRKVPSRTIKGAVTGDTSEAGVWLAILIMTGGFLILYTRKREHKKGDI